MNRKLWRVGQTLRLKGEKVRVFAKISDDVYDVMNLRGQMSRVKVQ